MKDINKKTLIEALSSLKEYEPPVAVWEHIDMEMEMGQEEIVPLNMLHNLPEYDPPVSVWSGIEKELHVQHGARVVPMRWKRTLAIAASFALLLSAYFLIGDNDPMDEIAMDYSTEVVDDVILVKDWQQDEEAFGLYKELCDAKKYICEHPEFQVLQSEFVELSDAVKELEYAIGNFGTSADLVSQIKDIELERTGIFKKMMVMLI